MGKDSDYQRIHKNRNQRLQRKNQIEERQHQNSKINDSLKQVHPNSRKADKLNSKHEKQVKTNAQQNLQDKKTQLKINKFIWFKNLNSDKPLTHSEAAEIVKNYLDEKSKELLENSSNQKQANNTKQYLLETVIQSEKEKFNNNGIEIPDLLTRNGLNSLKEWNETSNNLQKVKTVLVKSAWLKLI